MTINNAPFVNTQGWGAATTTTMTPYYNSKDDDLRTTVAAVIAVSRKRRSCTDLYCLFVLLSFLCGWLAVGYYAYWNGDITRLTAPEDTKGRRCGVDQDVIDKPYLIFYDITKCVKLSVFVFGCNTKQICVESCPNRHWFSDNVEKQTSKNWKYIRDSLICEDDTIKQSINSMETFHKAIKNEHCAPYYVKSSPAFFRYCLPNPLSSNSLNDLVDEQNLENSYEIAERVKSARNYFSNVFEDIGLIYKDFKKCWHLVALFVITATLVSLFTIVVMGIITKIFVWIILWFILLVLFYSTALAFVRYESLRVPSSELGNDTQQTDSLAIILLKAHGIHNYYDNSETLTDIDSDMIYNRLSWLFRQRETWLSLFVISAILFVIFAILVIFLRSRISLAVMLIGEGSKAINAIKSALCLPMISRLLQLGIVVWFLLLYLYIKSLGNSIYTVQGLTNDKDCHCSYYREGDWCVARQFNRECYSISASQNTTSCHFAKCTFFESRLPKLQLCLQLYNLFGLLWGLYFVSGFIRLSLSLCFKTWYWTYDKQDVPFFTLLFSLFVTVRYHLGTIAVGSFLIATCGFIRAILHRIHQTVKRADTFMTQCVAWSMKCCFWMLQRFFILISDSAYTMCAITGDSFFYSAGEALSLLARNILRALVLDKVLDFLMLVGKIVVTFLMTVLSYYSFSSNSLQLNYPLVPTVFVSILTWIIAASFFSVYTVAVDTLFLSFLRDTEINDGSRNKPYYMSQRLKCILKEQTSKSSSKQRD